MAINKPIKIRMNNTSELLKFRRTNDSQNNTIIEPVYVFKDTTLKQRLSGFTNKKTYIFNHNTNTTDESNTSPIISQVEIIDEIPSIDQNLKNDMFNPISIQYDDIDNNIWMNASIINSSNDYTTNSSLISYDVYKKVQDTLNSSIKPTGYMLAPINGNGVTLADLIDIAEWEISEEYDQHLIQLSQSNGYTISNKSIDYMEPITINYLNALSRYQADTSIPILRYYNDTWETINSDINIYQIPIFLDNIQMPNHWYNNNNQSQTGNIPYNDTSIGYIQFTIANDAFTYYSSTSDNMNEAIPLKYIIHKSRKFVNSRNNIVPYNIFYNHNINIYDNVKYLKIQKGGNDIKASTPYCFIDIENNANIQNKIKNQELNTNTYIAFNVTIENVFYTPYENDNNSILRDIKIIDTDNSYEENNPDTSLLNFLEYNFLYDSDKNRRDYNNLKNTSYDTNMTFKEKIEAITWYGTFDSIYSKDFERIDISPIQYNNQFSRKILEELPYTDIIMYDYALENITYNTLNLTYDFKCITNDDNIENNDKVLCFYTIQKDKKQYPSVFRLYWIISTPNYTASDKIYKVTIYENGKRIHYVYLNHKSLRYTLSIEYNPNYTSDNKALTNRPEFTKFAKNVSEYIISQPYYIPEKTGASPVGFYMFKPLQVNNENLKYQSYEIMHDTSNKESTADNGYKIEFNICIPNSSSSISVDTLNKNNWCLNLKIQYIEDILGNTNESSFKIPLQGFKQVPTETQNGVNIISNSNKTYNNIIYYKNIVNETKSVANNNNYKNAVELFEKLCGTTDSSYLYPYNNEIVNVSTGGIKGSKLYTKTIQCSKQLYNTDGTYTPCQITVHIDYLC